ncbi:MAG: hypothetical protein WC867_05450 [Candidatus Pacearchaeota archaeon]|jgi:hypothetical protein
MNITHTFFERKGFGGSETYFNILSSASKNNHSAKYVERSLQYKETFDNFYNGFENLIDSISKENPDIIHNHFFIPAEFSRIKGLQYILTSHCMLSEEFKLSLPDADTT